MKKRLFLFLLLLSAILLGGCGMNRAKEKMLAKKLKALAIERYGDAEFVSYSTQKDAPFTVTLRDSSYQFEYTVTATDRDNPAIDDSTFFANYGRNFLAMNDAALRDALKTSSGIYYTAEDMSANGPDGCFMTVQVGNELYLDRALAIIPIIRQYDTRDFFSDYCITFNAPDADGEMRCFGRYFLGAGEFVKADDSELLWMRKALFLRLTTGDNPEAISSEDALLFLKKQYLTEDELHALADFEPMNPSRPGEKYAVFTFSCNDRIYLCSKLLIAPNNAPLLIKQ